MLFYRITVEHNNLIVCLRIYVNELYNIFFTVPNSIFLLYDKKSEESFKSISRFYEDSIKNKKYENIKFFIIGNKKDLISEVEESEEISSKNIQIRITNKDNNKEEKKNEDIKIEDKNNEDKTIEVKNNEDKNIEDNNNKINNNEDKNKEDNNNEDKSNTKDKEDKEDQEDKEVKDNRDKKEDKEDEPLLTLEQKIEKFCRDKKILHREISGLSGEGVMELFEEVVLILYKDINNLQEDGKELDITSLSKNIEKELNLSSRQSYHSDDYKKEINKINKKRKFLCCYRCNIF